VGLTKRIAWRSNAWSSLAVHYVRPRHNRIVEQRCRNREQKDNEAQEAQITQKVANDTE
jgi:hypothetical protein